MKRVLVVFVSVLFTISLFALTPQKLYFQAVIRDGSNNIVVSHNVGMQISILQGAVDGTVVYLEAQTPTTDLNGIVSIEIGGSTEFNAINWSTGSYFIKMETDPTGGTDYTLSSTSQLISVPYALHSHTADSLTTEISETDPVFFVSPAFSITTSKINNWDSAFSWGNHADLYSLQGHTHPYLSLIGGEMANTNIVTNLNADLLDGQHGSFYAPSKGSANYISNQDSTAQTANLRINGNGTFGGIINVNGVQAIYVPDQSIYDESLIIGNGGRFLDPTAPNSLWPNSSSVNNAKQNTFIGIDAGRDNSSGNQNTFIGSLAGRENTIGDQNTFVGMNAGIRNITGYHSTYIGAWAGQQNTTGSGNAFLGTDAGNQNVSGSNNCFLGDVSGFNNITGNDNSFFGTTSGSNSVGCGNSFFGRAAGFNNTTGNYNTYIGYFSGYNPSQKVDAVNSTAIGNGAYTTADNQIVLGNSKVSETLMNGNLRLTTPNDENKISFYSSGSGVNERARIATMNDNSSYSTGELAFYTKNKAGVLTEQMRINKDGNIGFGYNTGINDKLYVNGTVNALSYKLNGNSIFLSPLTTGYAGKTGQILIGNGATSAPTWSNLAAAGIAPATGSSNYIQNQLTNAQAANLWINGDIKARQLTMSDGYGLNAGNFQVGGISAKRFYIYNLIKSVDNFNIFPTSGNSIFRYNLGVGYNSEATDVVNNKLAVNGNIYANGIMDATGYKISGILTFLSPLRTGFSGTTGQILIGNGATSAPTWSDLATAGIAPATGSSSYIQNQLANAQTANLWINGDIKARQLTITDGYGLNAGNFQVGGISAKRFYIYNLTKSVDNFNIFPTSGNSIFRYNLGVGYNSEATDVVNNKLAVNGNIFANGIITATGGKSTDWNTAYSWGNHAGLYRLISYVPSWSDISSNPFSITSSVNNQLLKYNSTTAKWENWTPNFITSFTETDPTFTAWDKTSGIKITVSQINDFQTSVTNNAAVIANTAKNSYPASDATKLSGIEAGAQKNVNADWNATNGDAQILNKPIITVGNNHGDMQYWNGTAWVLVSAGQPGQFLQFTASGIPQWTTVLPILTTATVSSITANSVISGGNIISSGGGTIIERGVCWSTSPDPTLSDSKTSDGTGTGAFTSLLTGLTVGTTYYMRAYATNSSYTAYGSEVHFSTSVN
ncbi:MAG TPA: hypothetical protein VFP20_10850 [Bacteroidales bacterium]|nr:hypothetical protein [Bacteroidales bacterium]